MDRKVDTLQAGRRCGKTVLTSKIMLQDYFKDAGFSEEISFLLTEAMLNSDSEDDENENNG